MKKILIHWVEMETLEVPDDCPTNSERKMWEWIDKNGGMKRYSVKRNSRDFQVVDIEEVEECRKT